MPFVTYTAERSIITGHTQSTSYSIDFEVQTIDPRPQDDKNQVVLKDGTVITTYYSRKMEWSVRTDFIHDDYIFPVATGVWGEFLDSVAGGETFTFDPQGTNASPSAKSMSCVMMGEPSWSRQEGTKYFTISFTVREQ